MDHAFHHLLLPGRKGPVSQLFCYNLQAPSLNLLRRTCSSSIIANHPPIFCRLPPCRGSFEAPAPACRTGSPGKHDNQSLRSPSLKPEIPFASRRASVTAGRNSRTVKDSVYIGTIDISAGRSVSFYRRRHRSGTLSVKEGRPRLPLSASYPCGFHTLRLHSRQVFEDTRHRLKTARNPGPRLFLVKRRYRT